MVMRSCDECQPLDGSSRVRLCRTCAKANQEALEDLSLVRTEERFTESMAKAEWQKRTSTVGGGRDLFWENVPKLKDALEAYLEKRRGDRRREKGATFRWVDKIGAEQTARTTLSVVLDHFPSTRKLRHASLEVAKRLQMELVARRVPRKDSAFEKGERFRVGLELIEEVEELGLVRLKRLDRAKHVVPTEEALRALAEQNDALRWRWPLFAPMLMRPRPWAEGEGGYRFALKGQLRLIHGAKGKPDPLPLVRRSLDKIQDTTWRVDESVLRLVQEIVSEGRGELGLPDFPQRAAATCENEPDDPWEWDIPDQPLDWWQWRGVQREASARRRVEQTLVIAEELCGVEIWFPHYMDWRGRIYPVAGAGVWDDDKYGGVFNPQAGDLARALLRFSKGKPLGQDGASWMALHGANCYGGDLGRESKDARVAWIEAHAAEIAQAAHSPRQSDLLRDAKEPLQFYAFAREWSAYMERKREGRGDAFVSHLPCGQDASCNGMQHFAALWRDEATAAKVNLLRSSPSDRPNDLYTSVADNARQRLIQAANDGDERAVRWAHLADDILTRDAIKRPAMTFVYGATLEGFTLQVVEHTERVTRSPQYAFTNEKPFVAMYGDYRFLAQILWDALEEETPGAVHGREWLQEVARAFVSVNRPVSWTVPITRLQVVQDGRKYMEQEVYRIKTKRQKLVEYRPTDRAKETKQVNGIAPNVIHSLDAAALALTIQRAFEEGVRSFGVVHDCYHVLAADAAAVAQAAREAFVRLHEEPILELLYERFSTQTGETVPVPSDMGSLDIRDVLRAEYFLI